MNLQKLKYIGLACAFVLPLGASAQEGTPPFEVYNRLRVEWDDNVRGSATNEQESAKIIEELELLTEFNLNNTFVGLRYNPSFTYFFDRDEDDTDLHHQFDGVIDHEFSPRLSINVKETFRLAELPELIEDGVITRQNNDYIYNSVNLGLNGKLSKMISSVVNARYTIIRYDDNIESQRSDYDKLTVGANLGAQIGTKTSAGAEVRYSEIGYEAESRDSESVQIGGSLQTLIGPGLKVDVRGGFETRDFDAANTDSADSPYASGQLTYSPNPDTSVVLGGSFSLAESSFVPYVNQERTTIFGILSRDLTAKINVRASASLSQSEYDGDETVAGSVATDGDETTVSAGVMGTYKVNRSNWVEVGYKYNELDSDVRSNDGFSRNRLHVGWKTKI